MAMHCTAYVSPSPSFSFSRSKFPIQKPKRSNFSPSRAFILAWIFAGGEHWWKGISVFRSFGIRPTNFWWFLFETYKSQPKWSIFGVDLFVFFIVFFSVEYSLLAMNYSFEFQCGALRAHRRYKMSARMNSKHRERDSMWFLTAFMV